MYIRYRYYIREQIVLDCGADASQRFMRDLIGAWRGFCGEARVIADNSLVVTGQAYGSTSN